MCAFCVLTGLSYLLIALVSGVDQTAPNSLRETIPTWAVLTWATFLVLGPGFTLLGSLWRAKSLSNIVTGMIVQRNGLIVTASATYIYSFAVGTYAWNNDLFVQALFTVVIQFGFATACVVRFFQVRRDLDSISHGTGE